jgi:hypothetical protein
MSWDRSESGNAGVVLLAVALAAGVSLAIGYERTHAELASDAPPRHAVAVVSVPPAVPHADEGDPHAVDDSDADSASAPMTVTSAEDD